MIHRGTNVRAARSAWSLGWMAVLALLVGVCMTPASAQTVFFTQDEASDSNDEVLSVDAAGQQTVVGNTIKTDPHGVVTDVPRGRVYWTEDGKILLAQLADLDGDVTEVQTGLTDVKAIAVVESDGSLVWIADGSIWFLRRGKVNAKNLSQYIASKTGLSTGTPEDLCVDGRTLYWTDSDNDRVAFASKQGGPISADVIDDTPGIEPRGIHCYGASLFWTDIANDAVMRTPIGDGSGASTIFMDTFNGQPLVDPQDVAVAKPIGFVYTTDTGNDRIVTNMIDGTELDSFATVAPPVGVAVNGTVGVEEAGMICPFGKPGSVVIWPYVNSDEGKTLISLTNTNSSHIYCGGGEPDIFEGTVRIKFLFIHGEFCTVGNQIITLTPNDTFTAFVDDMNLGGGGEEGWLLAAAVSALDDQDTGLPQMIDYDWLVGNAQVYTTDEDIVWGYDAYTFRGLTERGRGGEGKGQGDNQGEPLTDDCGHVFTDDDPMFGDGDGAIDFDNNEYDAFPLVNSVVRIADQDAKDNVTSFLGVMATARGPLPGGEDEHDVFVRIFDNNEDLAASGSFDLRCLRAGDLAEEFNFLIVEAGLGGGPDPNGFPEDPGNGWLHMWSGNEPAEDTPAILSVFALINNGSWVAGNNNWREPAVFRAKQITSFDLDLDE